MIIIMALTTDYEYSSLLGSNNHIYSVVLQSLMKDKA